MCCLHWIWMMISCSMEGEGETTNGPNWLELPRVITENILQKVGAVEIVMSASQVCSLWWNICKGPLMWRTIFMTKHLEYPNSKLVEICRYAVERSCGHLEVISIEYFATDDLLKYIADRASNLQVMRLPRCDAISAEGLLAIFDGCPLLESLDMHACFNVGLSRSLRKRCHDQLKEIRLPRDFEFKTPDECPSDFEFKVEDFLENFPSAWEISSIADSITVDPDFLSDDDYSDYYSQL